jgi:hypothetical protein
MESVVRLNLILMTVLVVQSATASTSTACPVCDTGTGEQVRAGILDENFGSTLLTVLLPFPIVLGVVAMIHFGLPRPGCARAARAGRRLHTRDQR